MCLLKCHTSKKKKKKTNLLKRVHSAIIPRSDCCVVWDLSWISSSDRGGVGLRKGKGGDGVCGGGGWCVGGVEGHCSVNLACEEGRRIVESAWRNMLAV